MVLRKSSYKMIKESMANQAKHANSTGSAQLDDSSVPSRGSTREAGPSEHSTRTDDDIHPLTTWKKTMDFVAPTPTNCC